MLRFNRSRLARHVLIATVAAAVAAPERVGAQVSYEVLHTFPSGSETDVVASLIVGTDGNLYGTIPTGGVANLGIVFQMTPDGDVTVLHEFAGGTTDGATPRAALLEAPDGTFYGTTSAGGTADAGTIFNIDSIGNITLVHSFAGSGSGADPRASLIRATDGSYYGTTYGDSTIFQMTPEGVVTVLHQLTGAEGTKPHAALIQATDGNFYGTTTLGGTPRLSNTPGITDTRRRNGLSDDARRRRHGPAHL